MRKLIDVARRASSGAPVCHQTFVYESDDENATVATALREINARPELLDADSKPAEAIRWECSCLQRKCGSCAMVVEGVPRLACDARLAEFKGETVHLEPLRKFPVVADLIVDRRTVYENLKTIEAWLADEVELPVKTSGVAYEASRCLECGCCLEACPNFSATGEFFGMAAMVPMSRLLAELPRDKRREVARRYREHVYGGCSKSLACRSICPAGIDIDRLMARSNAAAVWRWL